VNVKRLIPLIVLVVLVMILAGSSASAVSDTGTSLADSDTPDNEINASQVGASNSSVGATIVITMTGIVDR